MLLVDRFDVVPVLLVSVVAMLNLGNGVEKTDADQALILPAVADQLQAAECVAIN